MEDSTVENRPMHLLNMVRNRSASGVRYGHFPLDRPLTIDAAREDRAAKTRALLPGPVPVSERRNSLNL